MAESDAQRPLHAYLDSLAVTAGASPAASVSSRKSIRSIRFRQDSASPRPPAGDGAGLSAALSGTGDHDEQPEADLLVLAQVKAHVLTTALSSAEAWLARQEGGREPAAVRLLVAMGVSRLEAIVRHATTGVSLPPPGADASRLALPVAATKLLLALSRPTASKWLLLQPLASRYSATPSASPPPTPTTRSARRRRTCSLISSRCRRRT